MRTATVTIRKRQIRTTRTIKAKGITISIKTTNTKVAKTTSTSSISSSSTMVVADTMMKRESALAIIRRNVNPYAVAITMLRPTTLIKMRVGTMMDISKDTRTNTTTTNTMIKVHLLPVSSLILDKVPMGQGLGAEVTIRKKSRKPSVTSQ